MGDRTTVTLTVLKQHQQEAIDLIEDEQGKPSEIDQHDDETVTMTYEEVNYGTIEKLSTLARAGIPYSFEWGSGGSYTEGEEHLRYLLDGTPVVTTFDKEWPADTICECLDAIKDQADPEAALRTLLDAKQEPGWENQLEYSNVARTANLLQQ